MGRFARSQYVPTPTTLAKPDFSSGREIKSKKFKSQASRLDGQQAKGMKYLWIVLVSIVGLSAGWMIGHAWMNSTQDAPTQVVANKPLASAEVSTESKLPSELNAIPAAVSDSDEQDLEPNQVSDGDERKGSKPRQAVARGTRARAQKGQAAGPVTMVLKPFKALNPLKLRKLRPW